MRDCAQNNVRNVIIISSGFGEAGEAGQKRLEETLKFARQGGIRILGPNTTGILSPKFRFSTTFVPLTTEIKAGSVAFIAQTGLFAGVMLLHIMTAEHFGISKVAGLGNKSDTDEADILEYLYEDEDTRAVMIYMEGVKDGRRFLDVARKFTCTKPLVLLKGGRTPAGAKAAFSHTGSLTGQYSLIETLAKQAGIILAHDVEEMMDFAKALAYQPLPRGHYVGIASMSGGAAVMASDTITEAGLDLAPLDSQCLSYLQTLLPEWAVATHPLDLEPLMETIGGNEAYRIGLETLLSDPSVDMCLLVIGVGIFRETEGNLITTLAPLLRKRDKPVVVSLIGTKKVCELLTAQLEEMKVPTYPTVSRAAKSLAAMSQYAELKLGSGG
jgi:acyl-CoA synthetase (NDP forming)